MTRAWVTGRPLPRPVRVLPPRAGLAVVAALMAAGLVLSALVALERTGPDTSVPSVAVDEPVALAVAFVAGVVTPDTDRRARTIGALVVPRRVTEFVTVLDREIASRTATGARIAATPRGFKVVESSRAIRVVLVWTQVLRTDDGPVSGPDESWEVWGIGLMLRGARWEIFSYEGYEAGVPPGDPRLDGFSELLS